LDRQPVEVV